MISKNNDIKEKDGSTPKRSKTTTIEAEVENSSESYIGELFESPDEWSTEEETEVGVENVAEGKNNNKNGVVNNKNIVDDKKLVEEKVAIDVEKMKEIMVRISDVKVNKRYSRKYVLAYGHWKELLDNLDDAVKGKVDGDVDPVNNIRLAVFLIISFICGIHPNNVMTLSGHHIKINKTTIELVMHNNHNFGMETEYTLPHYTGSGINLVVWFERLKSLPNNYLSQVMKINGDVHHVKTYYQQMFSWNLHHVVKLEYDAFSVKLHNIRKGGAKAALDRGVPHDVFERVFGVQWNPIRGYGFHIHRRPTEIVASFF